MSWLAEACLLIFVLALGGGLVPLLLRRTERIQHLVIAFASGVFLGMVFLHLLPEVGALAPSDGDGHGHGHGDTGLWFFVLIGVVFLFLLENLAFRPRAEGHSHEGNGHARHRTIGYATFFGLSVHSFTSGLGLSAGVEVEALQSTLLLSVVSHKVIEGFSLSAALLLAGLKVRHILVAVLAFALVTPAGAYLRMLLAPDMSPDGMHIFTALAAGTFLFVALCDLLPDVFHHRNDTPAKIGLLAAGILVSLALTPENMPTVTQFGRELVHLVCESAPYLLIGFLIAGLMKVMIPARMIHGHLGGNDFRSVFRASLYGVPVPLCSCSVLPTATALKDSGASRGATASFLISTPETGVDSISVTWALLDPVMTVVRPVVAFATALVTGTAVNRLAPTPAGPATPPADEHADHDHAAAPEHPLGDEDGVGPSLGARLKAACDYAFGPLLDDLTPWLIIGFLVSALIGAVLPDSFFTDTIPSGWPAMLLMAVVATPMYICATASTPVAAVLIAKGLDPGAALVFLLVGPATNTTTLLVVSRLLGKRALVVYLAGITLVALFAGWLVSLLYAHTDLDLAATVSAGLEHAPGVVSAVAGALLTLLLVRSAWRQVRARRTTSAN